MCNVNGKGGTCANRGLALPLDLRLAISLSWCIGNNAEFVWIALRSTGFPVIEEHWLSVSGLVER